MKRIAALVLVIVLSLALVACGGKKESGTIKIGLLGCVTGDGAQYGIAVFNGVKLYINKVNAEGGVNGKKIELVEYDDKATRRKPSTPSPAWSTTTRSTRSSAPF